jgi:tetratricopeptide (TPR) repeat protein
MLFGLLAQPTLPAATRQKLSAVTLLEMYDRGDYAGAISEINRAADLPDLDRVDSELSAQAKDWIQDLGTAAQRRRAYVAGAVALEITHVLTARESWLTSYQGSHAVNPAGLLEVTRLISRESAQPLAVLDHDWVLASLATWQDWDPAARMPSDWRMTPNPAWAVLLGRPQLLEHLKMATAIPKGGVLDTMLRRFPGDPRLLLAAVEGREALETRCADQFCHDEMTPAAVDDLRRRAKASAPRNEDVHCVYCWPYALLRDIRDSAIANLAAFDRVLPIAAEFAKLANQYPSVRAEADVHIGYLAIRAGRPDASLQPLAAAVTSDDPYVRYLAEHFTGRALEMLARRTDAIAAYRRALSIVPNAASTSALLAAQLFVSNDAAERTEAHTILESANAASPRPADPWDLYWQGDARLWPVYMARLRQDLRP